MKIKLKNTSIILRKADDGDKTLIIGLALYVEVPGLIINDDDYLVLGDIEIDIKHMFQKFAPFNEDVPYNVKLENSFKSELTPDEMLKRGGLEYENYLIKIL